MVPIADHLRNMSGENNDNVIISAGMSTEPTVVSTNHVRRRTRHTGVGDYQINTTDDPIPCKAAEKVSTQAKYKSSDTYGKPAFWLPIGTAVDNAPNESDVVKFYPDRSDAGHVADGPEETDAARLSLPLVSSKITET